jgi:hypothetical protein
MNKQENKEAAQEFKEYTGVTFEEFIKSATDEVLLAIGNRVCSEEWAVKNYNFKNHPQFYKNRKRLLSALRLQWDGGSFSRRRQIVDFVCSGMRGGYNGYSKSNRAIQAEREGKYPASVLAKKLGIKTSAIRMFLCPCEWHHTSKFYNKVNYYDGAILLAIHAEDPLDDKHILDKLGIDEVQLNEAKELYSQLKGSKEVA